MGFPCISNVDVNDVNQSSKIKIRNLVKSVISPMKKTGLEFLNMKIH